MAPEKENHGNDKLLDIFIQKGVETRWKQESGTAERVIFLSPFVTGPLADEVLTAKKGGQAELYTTFSARNFAARASCLDTLERLLSAGVGILEVLDLHAKIMLVPGKVATIGSQNLTQGGRRNLEASILTTDPSTLRRIEDEITPWIKQGQGRPITAERIADMRQRVAEIKALWNKFNQASQRQDEDERKKHVVSNIRKTRGPASEIIEGEVRKDRSLPKSYRLIFKAKKTLRDLRLKPGVPMPKRTRRYLCINEDTGKLGWARVGETEISVVSSHIPHDYDVSINGETSPTQISAVWEAAGLRTHNLEIGLVLGGCECQLHCMFDTIQLTAVDCIWTPKPEMSAPELDLIGYVNGNVDKIADDLISLITGLPDNLPNDKLIGVYANEFFGESGTLCQIRVTSVGSHPVLVYRVTSRLTSSEKDAKR